MDSKVKTSTWLELAEYLSLGSLFFGVITTVITKEILYLFIPLSFTFLFNTINIQKYKKNNRLVLTELQQNHKNYNDIGSSTTKG
ncbi:MAG: hypothetical protein QNJ60_00990 [Xenococcaceae cyanobacterium MO_188.B19]|nr:hypothetical protein [Xenococcaceae cyanobacterium MO_188.B19]